MFCRSQARRRCRSLQCLAQAEMGFHIPASRLNAPKCISIPIPYETTDDEELERTIEEELTRLKKEKGRPAERSRAAAQSLNVDMQNPETLSLKVCAYIYPFVRLFDGKSPSGARSQARHIHELVFLMTRRDGSKDMFLRGRRSGGAVRSSPLFYAVTNEAVFVGDAFAVLLARGILQGGIEASKKATN